MPLASAVSTSLALAAIFVGTAIARQTTLVDLADDDDDAFVFDTTGVTHDRAGADKFQTLYSGSRQLHEPLDAILEADLQYASKRGKKSVYDSSSAYGEPVYYDYYSEKRAPMGFQGMRGKKAYYGNDGRGYEWLAKRAPMGFQGVRGKKSFEEALGEWEKRAPMGFQGMRGKKTADGEYEDDEQNNNDELQYKRAPMGFQGMRGRKSYYEQLLSDELEKRAMLGFQSTRGRQDPSYEAEQLAADEDGYLEKRSMTMGFHGMRGKRSVDDLDMPHRYYLSKRSAYQHYDPLRGKKNPRLALHGKFVGVRGKKWSDSPNYSSRGLLVPLSYFDQLALVNNVEPAAATWH